MAHRTASGPHGAAGAVSRCIRCGVSAPEAKRAVLDAQLAGNTWTSGATFTLTDCAAAPALFYARVVHRWSEHDQPNVARYYRDLLRRPSFAHVVEEARPYRQLFPMSWPADVDAP